MSAAWAAVAVAGTANLAAAGILVWKTGRWAGQLAATLDELRRIGKNHERRLRVLEGDRR